MGWACYKQGCWKSHHRSLNLRSSLIYHNSYSLMLQQRANELMHDFDSQVRTNNRIRLDSRRLRLVRRSIIASFPSQRLIDRKNQSRARMAAFVKIRLGDQLDWFGGPMFIVSFRLRSTTEKSVETRARKVQLIYEVQCQPCDSI